MKLLKQTILFLFHFLWIALVVGIVFGGIYLRTKGFTKSWRRLVNEEFEKHGISVQIERLTLDPFRGLIASNVRISDPHHAGEVLANVSHIGLDVNYANLIQKKTFLNSIDIRDANLSIPLDPSDKDSPKISADHVTAEIFFPPGQMQVSQAAFYLYGVRVSLAGTLLYPEGYKPPKEKRDSKEIERRKALLKRITKVLSQIEYPEGAPHVEIQFSGDITNLMALEISKLVLRSKKIIRDEIELSHLELDANIRSGVAYLQRLQAGDDEGGNFLMSGQYNMRAETGQFSLKSSLNIGWIIDEILGRKVLSEIVFYDPPSLEAEAFVNLKSKTTPLTVIGSTKLNRFGLRSIIFDGFQTAFAWNGEQFLLQKLQIKHRSGTLVANALKTREIIRIKLESSLNPSTLAPLLDGKALGMLEEFDFYDKTYLWLEAEGPGLDPLAMHAVGKMECLNAAYRKVPFKKMTADIEMRDKQVIYRNLHVERKEGEANGTFIYDFGRGQARMENLAMNLNLQEVALWVDKKLVQDVAPYRFPKAPPHLLLNGTVKIGSSTNSELNVQVDAPEGMLYEFAGKDLPLERVQGEMLFRGPRLFLKNVRSRLYDGRINVDADISIVRENPGHTATITMEGINFAKLTKLYFNYNASEGEVFGRYQYKFTRSPRDMKGEGTVEVVNGNVFAIPVLGPFSGILNEIVPGMGFSNSRKATADFTVENGVIDTRNFEVHGQGFSMFGEGDIHFLDDKMDFTVRINAKGISGVLLFPVSKLFEYTSDRSFSKPNWHPKNFSRTP